MITHEVLNQAPSRAGVNEYTSNPALVEAVARWGRPAAADASGSALAEAGALVGAPEFQRDAELANTITPVLHSHDRYGRRVDEVEYHPAYHRIIGDAVARGAHTGAWADPGPGASSDRAAMFYLFAQVEPGHACPVSMTHAGFELLQNTHFAYRDEWTGRSLSTSYDSELHPGKSSALFGMAMTEKQGGSDVRANTTRAVRTGASDDVDTAYAITGHKWFCSAPMSDGFFVLAQTRSVHEHEALSCFFVPRVLPDGTRNPFLIQRLKNKLGNRSNASSEVEFEGTLGWLVGDEGKGVRSILPMVSRTRLDCVIGSAAGMRQCVAEAAHHARHRMAFGRVLIDQPAMAAVIADLQLESEAATLTALRLARAHDADADEHEQAFRRIATAVAKYWVCKRGPGHAYEALECLGGNGYTEDFPLARRYREQPVMAVWEGSGNVIALDVLRALAREPEAVEAFFDVAGEAEHADASFDARLREAKDLAAELAVSDAATAAPRARELAERMAIVLEASLVLQHSPRPVADAFARTRLGGGWLYGALPAGVDVTGILERA